MIGEFSMPRGSIRPVLTFVLCLLGLMAVTASAIAEVTRIEFTSKQPYGTFRVGDYVMWQGMISGELSPQEGIPGLDKATRNDCGRVGYSARIILIMPASPHAGNGALLVDVPNRGRAYAEALYNSPRDTPFLSGTLEQGTGFLQDQGFTVAEVYWELGHDAELPSFVDAEKKTATSRAWDLRSCATQRTSWRTPRPIAVELPTRSRERLTARSRAESPRTGDF